MVGRAEDRGRRSFNASDMGYGWWRWRLAHTHRGSISGLPPSVAILPPLHITLTADGRKIVSLYVVYKKFRVKSFRSKMQSVNYTQNSKAGLWRGDWSTSAPVATGSNESQCLVSLALATFHN